MLISSESFYPVLECRSLRVGVLYAAEPLSVWDCDARAQVARCNGGCVIPGPGLVKVHFTLILNYIYDGGQWMEPSDFAFRVGNAIMHCNNSGRKR